MYKRVIKTMITLVVVFLIALYVLKIFMPEQFIMVIENDNLIAIGNYIDNNLWLYIILNIITSFLTYWLYIGAVTKKWRLNWKELIAVLIAYYVVIERLKGKELYEAIGYSEAQTKRKRTKILNLINK